MNGFVFAVLILYRNTEILFNIHTPEMYMEMPYARNNFSFIDPLDDLIFPGGEGV